MSLNVGASSSTSNPATQGAKRKRPYSEYLCPEIVSLVTKMGGPENEVKKFKEEVNELEKRFLIEKEQLWKKAVDISEKPEEKQGAQQPSVQQSVQPSVQSSVQSSGNPTAISTPTTKISCDCAICQEVEYEYKENTLKVRGPEEYAMMLAVERQELEIDVEMFQQMVAHKLAPIDEEDRIDTARKYSKCGEIVEKMKSDPVWKSAVDVVRRALIGKILDDHEPGTLSDELTDYLFTPSSPMSSYGDARVFD